MRDLSIEANLSRMHAEVVAIMRDLSWRTLSQIKAEMSTVHETTGIAARLRELSQAGWKIEKRFVTPKIYEYRLATKNPDPEFKKKAEPIGTVAMLQRENLCLREVMIKAADSLRNAAVCPH